MFRSLRIDSSSLIALGSERFQVLSPKTNLTKIINDYNYITIISSVAIFTFIWFLKIASQQKVTELLLLLLPSI